MEMPCELDSHADTCVAGANTLMIGDNGRKVNVTGFLDELDVG